MSFKEEVKQHLSEIKSELVEHKIELRTMNAELKEHTRRSTNLEDRVKPLEDSHVFFNKLAKALTAIAAIAASVLTAYHYISR